ncbi:hypothetical protein GCM10023164_11590 [Christiangramia aestuarii]
MYGQQISVSSQSPSCSGNSDGAIDISVTGGTTPYSYSWSGPNGFSSTSEDLNSIGEGSYTVTVTDANSNTVSETIDLNFQDNTDPQVVTKNFTVQLDATGNASIAEDAVNNGSSDACGGLTFNTNITSFNCDDVGANTVELTVTDANGNSAKATAIVTVEDKIAPQVITSDITAQLDATGNASIAEDAVNSGSSDNCGGLTFDTNITSFNCADVGANTVELTVTDANGNSAKATAKVTVEDNIAPQVITSDITVQLDANGNATIAEDAVNSGSSDNCGGLTFDTNITSFNCANVGANTVELTVTDANGNSAKATAIVTVEDKIAPQVVTSDITVQLDANGNATIAEDAVNSGSSDNCGGLTFDTNITSFNCTDLGANTVELTVTDANGNSAKATAIVTVEDKIAPQVNTSDITVQLDANGNATIAEDAVNSGSSDNCGGLTFDTNITNFNCADVGANTVELTVSDANGNSAKATAIVTVEDKIAPQVITSDITVQLDANGNATIAEDAVNSGSSDNCGGLTFDTNIKSFNCADVGANTVELTVTDANGNSTKATAIVTVEDKITPQVITSDITVQLDANGNATIAEDAVNNGSSDTCGGLTFDTNITSFNCDDVGANTVELTVTDTNGNSAKATAIVTVEDTINPVITVANDISATNDTGKCEAGLSIAPPSITDNCEAGNPVGTRDDGLELDEPYPVGSTIITWSVQDNNGNFADEVTQTVTVEDNQAPVLPEVQDIFWGCEYTVEPPVTTDNCSGSITGTTNDPLTYSSTGTYEIEWSFEDEYGNISRLTQTIEIDELRVSISKTDILCNGFQTGEAIATTNGGVKPYDYSWINTETNTDLGNNSSISDIPAGNYSVSVTDLNGCQVIETIEITEPSALSMTTPSSTPVTCFEGSDGIINVGQMTGGTAPYTYSLDNSNFQSGTTFENLTAGNYTIFVKDSNECSLQVDLSITEPEILSGSLSKTDVSCYEGTDGEISISNARGGNAGYEFRINGSTWQSSPDFTGLSAGSYQVDIRDDSQTACEISLGEINLTQPSAPLEVTATSTNTTTFGTSSGTVTANPTGGTPGYFYEWRKTGSTEILKTTKTVNNLPAGEYEVIVKDANGCRSETIKVTVLDALFAEIDSAAICESDDKQGDDPIRTAYFRVTGFSALGGSGSYTYSWDFGENKSATGVGEHAVVYNSPGNKTIKLTVTDTVSNQEVVITRQQYVGLCYEPCGQAQNFQFNVDGIYIGDINGNELDLDDPNVCSSNIDMYLFLPVSKNVNVYNPYTEVTFNTSSGILEDLLETQEDFGCKDGDEIDEIPESENQGKINRVGEFIRLTIDPIEYECGDNLNIDSFYITYTNVSKKDCLSNNNGFCYSTNEPVTVPTPVYVSATPNHIQCFEASTGFIEVKGSGGFAPYTYSLTGNAEDYQTTSIFNNLGAGDYTVYIKDSRGNEGSTTVTINQPVSAVKITASKTDPPCFGENGSASAVVEGGTPFYDNNGDPYYEILWNDTSSQTTVNAESLSPGEYTVTATDANGCQAISTVSIIEAPELTEPEAGEDIELGCGRFDITLNANTPETGVGTWTIDTENSDLNGNIASPTNPNSEFSAPEGVYNLVWTIANEDGSCAKSDSVTISITGECSQLDFDGIDDYVSTGDTYPLNSGNFTLEVWVKPESTTGIQTILSKKDRSSASTGYELIINNGAPTFRWNGNTVSTSSKVKTDRWYHIAVIYNGTARLYVDGLDVGNKTGANPSSTSAPFILGALYDSSTPNTPTNYYSGWIEELRIWNKALTKEQLRFMMNQRIKLSGGLTSNTLIEGELIPNKSIPGSYYTSNNLNLDANGNPFYDLKWGNLLGYYRLISVDPDPLNYLEFDESLKPSSGSTPDLSLESVPGILYNIETDQNNTAPLPYISNQNGRWQAQSTWLRPSVWSFPNDKGINNKKIDWNIASTSNDIYSDDDINLLGLISNSNELKINGDVAAENGQGLTVTHYLKLDGSINLEGNSQLVQTQGSILDDSSTGSIDIDQQGTANSFNYNYWTSPVSLQGQTNNYGFKIAEVLLDATTPENPKDLSFNYQYHWADGGSTNPKRISSYWLYTFQGTADDYFQWGQVSETEVLKPGIGYSMKGTTGYVPISNRQNYTFRGKPNNGDITVNVGAGQNLLTGNPYPSAIDSYQFIDENLGDFNGSIYFWDHFGKEDTHYLEEYIGGYAVMNKSGAVAAASSIDSRINDTGDKGNATPGQYIPVGQAFFISTIGVSSPNSITFKNKYRAFVPESTSDSHFHMKEDPVTKKSKDYAYKKDTRFKIRLKFKSPKGYHRQILVAADANSTQGFDLGYDAPLIENNVEDMYWMIDETEFVIQAVPNFNLDQVLPIGFKVAEPGEYTIKIDSLENIKTNFDIYLHDIKEDSFFNISKKEYTANIEETGVFNERYEITFRKPQTEEQVEEKPEIELDDRILGLQYLKDTDQIALSNPDLMNLDFVELYSISGQKIMSFREVPTQKDILLNVDQKLSSAVYIVKVYSGNKSYSKKVIITK